jgi:hypothetical protein
LKKNKNCPKKKSPEVPKRMNADELEGSEASKGSVRGRYERTETLPDSHPDAGMKISTAESQSGSL